MTKRGSTRMWWMPRGMRHHSTGGRGKVSDVKALAMPV
jgi:hypothetical protein